MCLLPQKPKRRKHALLKSTLLCDVNMLLVLRIEQPTFDFSPFIVVLSSGKIAPTKACAWMDGQKKGKTKRVSEMMLELHKKRLLWQ
jgi:hypothetical protein